MLEACHFTITELFHKYFLGILTATSPSIVIEYPFLTEHGCLCSGENV